MEQKELTQEELQDLLEHIKAIKALGLVCELVGSWVWVSGKTKEQKEGLKKLGCRWAPKKKVWYYHTGPAHHYRRRSEKDLDEIKAKYGCQKI